MTSTQLQLQRILVATDFSEHSKKALGCAIELATAFQGQLKVVHCLPDFAFVPSASEFGLPFDDYMLMQQDFRREADKSMEEFLSGNVPRDFPVSSSMLMGNPSFEISEFAKLEKADYWSSVEQENRAGANSFWAAQVVALFTVAHVRYFRLATIGRERPKQS